MPHSDRSAFQGRDNSFRECNHMICERHKSAAPVGTHGVTQLSEARSPDPGCWGALWPARRQGVCSESIHGLCVRSRRHGATAGDSQPVAPSLP